MPSSVSAASGIEVVDRTGDGIWTDNVWQVEIFPGEVKSTTLTLYNSSSSSLGVEMNVEPNSLDNGNLEFELDKSNFTMSGGSYTDVTLTVKASGSATPGTYTAELEIKSGVAPPSVTTKYAYPITSSSALLHGKLDSLGTASSVVVYFEWGTTTTNYDHQTRARTLKRPRHFSAVITRLTPDTMYYFRAVAVSEDGTSYGEERSFTTNPRRHWWKWIFDKIFYPPNWPFGASLVGG